MRKNKTQLSKKKPDKDYDKEYFYEEDSYIDEWTYRDGLHYLNMLMENYKNSSE